MLPFLDMKKPSTVTLIDERQSITDDNGEDTRDLHSLMEDLISAIDRKSPHDAARIFMSAVHICDSMSQEREGDDEQT